MPLVGVPGGIVVVPVRIRGYGGEPSLFTTIATFGTPLDVTIAELSIELVYPADGRTAEASRSTSPAIDHPPLPVGHRASGRGLLLVFGRVVAFTSQAVLRR